MMITGYCRFSWFGISDTGRAIADLETARRLLWHPQRMAVRFHLFETIMLPSIRAQGDTDFRLRLIVSADMPQPYLDRLEHVTADTPMIELLATPERDIGRALAPDMKVAEAAAKPGIQFRIDDDDALSTDYISRLRTIAERGDFAPGTAISFPTGVIGFLHEGRAKHATYHKSYVAAGLAFVVGKGYRRNPFQVQHRQVGSRQPSYVDPTWIAYHVSQHAVNNTKGYDSIVHDLTSTSRGIDKVLRNNPDLATQQVVSEDLDTQIDHAFGFSGGAGLRRSLEESLDSQKLARRFGFA